MIAKILRTITDFFGLSPFGSERTDGPDRTFTDYGPVGANRSLRRSYRTGADRGTGYCTPLSGGQSVPVR